MRQTGQAAVLVLGLLAVGLWLGLTYVCGLVDADRDLDVGYSPVTWLELVVPAMAASTAAEYPRAQNTASIRSTAVPALPSHGLRRGSRAAAVS
jgi:hypothetical protein